MCARSHITIIAATIVTILASGCNQSRGVTAPGASTSGWTQPNAALPNVTLPQEAQLQDLGRRASALDADNRDLHTELARTDQQNQLLKQELTLVREQLAKLSSQMRETELAKQEANRQVEALQASVTRGGGAILKANNSLQDSLQLIQIAGLDVRQDGDVIRIEVPADQLFQAGTSQMLPSAYTLLDQVATSLNRAYPQHKIGIEGYTDNSSVSAGSSHQLTSAQASAVVDNLIRRNQVPETELLLVSHGANHPRASNATPAGQAKNRRIEFVVYPETVP
ncbi:MAG: OmpA family protein [Planctomycetia bacterium]|nr:OmpA family protein [Planctomycetia bacterium]